MANKVGITNGLKFTTTDSTIFTIENINKSGEYCEVSWVNDKKEHILYPVSYVDENINITKVWHVVDETLPSEINYRQEFHKIAEKHCEHVIGLILEGKSSFCRFTLMSMMCNAGEEFIEKFLKK